MTIRNWVWLDPGGDPYAVAVAAGFVGAVGSKGGERHFHVRKALFSSGARVRLTVLVQPDLARPDYEVEVLTVSLSTEGDRPVLRRIDSCLMYDPDGTRHLSALVAAGWFLDQLGAVVDEVNLTASEGTFRQMIQARGGPPHVPVHGELGWTEEEGTVYELLGEPLPVYWEAEELVCWGEDRAAASGSSP